MTRRAILFDRDGTLNQEVGHLVSLDLLTILPGAPAAVALAREQGFATVVITNQSGISRGLFGEDVVREANRRVIEACGGFDAVYYCPHYLEGCSCRKPAPGMIQQAARELGFDPENAFVIGDSVSDVGAARSAGAKVVVVLTGKGRETVATLGENPPDHVAPDVLAAVHWILRTTTAEISG